MSHFYLCYKKIVVLNLKINNNYYYTPAMFLYSLLSHLCVSTPSTGL